MWSHLCNILSNRKIKISVTQGHPRTLNQALALAVVYESIMQTEESRMAPLEKKTRKSGTDEENTKSETTSSVLAATVDSLNGVQEQLASLMQIFRQNQNSPAEEPRETTEGRGGRRRFRGDRPCFISNKPGHSAVNCVQMRADRDQPATIRSQQLPRSELRIRRGQRRRSAWKHSVGGERRGRGVVFSLTQKDRHEQRAGIYIQGEVYGQTFTMLVDTGSTVSILSIDARKRLKEPGMKLQLHNTNLFGLGGDHLATWGKRDIPIKIGRASILQEMIVGACTDGVILGMEFLRQHVTQPDFPSLTMTIDKEEIDIFYYIKPPPPEKSRVIAESDMIIPAQSEKLMTACVGAARITE
jgi:hypothetical protein